jgi:hypothetical protein
MGHPPWNLAVVVDGGSKRFWGMDVVIVAEPGKQGQEKKCLTLGIGFVILYPGIAV